METLIRFYFHLDPTVMTDEELAYTWQDLQFCLKFEQNRISTGEIQL